MSIQRDPNAIIAAWIDDGPTDLPGTTRRAITTSLPITQQRRGSGLPWRLPQMSTSLRLILLATALVLVAGGVYLFSGGGGRPAVVIAPSPGVTSVATIGPTATVASPTPSSSPTAASLGLSGRIVFNRYNTEASMYGDALGLFIANADGSDEQKLPVETDGAVISPDGTQLLLSNPFQDGKYRPAVANIDGSNVRRLDLPGTFGMWCSGWSPDGERVSCKVDSDQRVKKPGVYTLSATNAADFKLVAGGSPPSVSGSKSECGGGDVAGDFSPDGTQLVFMRTWCGSGDDPVANQQAAIYVVDATGRGAPREIVPRGIANSNEGPPRWSPDGTRIVFGLANFDLATVDPAGGPIQSITPKVSGPFYAYSPDWSPDGQWIMFTLWQRGYARSDLYVIRPDGTGLTLVARTGGTEDLVSWGVTAP